MRGCASRHARTHSEFRQDHGRGDGGSSVFLLFRGVGSVVLPGAAGRGTPISLCRPGANLDGLLFGDSKREEKLVVGPPARALRTRRASGPWPGRRGLPRGASPPTSACPPQAGTRRGKAPPSMLARSRCLFLRSRIWFPMLRNRPSITSADGSSEEVRTARISSMESPAWR